MDIGRIGFKGGNDEGPATVYLTPPIFKSCKTSYYGGNHMFITDESQLFIIEMRRLLDDYERSPHKIKADIMEDVIVLAHALNKKNRQKHQ